MEQNLEAAGEAAVKSAKQTVKQAEKYWEKLGPGLVTGAADDDPSGIATYSQTGAQYGFGLLWLATFTFPLMAVIQEMCARIGLVTGRGLAANIRAHYPRKILYATTALLFAANAFNIGADLGAMTKATQLIFPRADFNYTIIGFSLCILVMQIFMSYQKYARYLKWLALMLVSYILSAILTDLHWRELLRGAIIPSLSFSSGQILLVTAILGTTISPYLFFWQTSQEVEEQILDGKTTVKSRAGTTKAEIKKMRLDVWSGMFFSNVVMFFIIAATAGALFSRGITNIATSADAAMALRPLAGDAAYLLFALGIIGTGLLAIPILAGSASYAISESLKWKEGLYRKFRDAVGFYGIIIAAMIIGLATNFIGLDPIKALIYAAVGNALVAPLILVFIIQLSNNQKVMGEYANSPRVTAWGWIIVGLMGLAGMATIISLFA